MPNFYSDNDDLVYYLEKGIDWATLIEEVESRTDDPERFTDAESARSFYRDILDMVGGFSADEIAPHAATIDRAPFHLENGEVVVPECLQEIYAKLASLELAGMSLPRELGGMNCPMVIYHLTGELLARADVSVMTHHGFHGGIAMAMLIYSILEGTTKINQETGRIESTRFEKEIGDILENGEWGSMDITEPDAGSDMAALRTHAESDESGNWFLTGQKIFITSGHGKYHIAIARTAVTENVDEPTAGLDALSLFLVPAFEEDSEGNRIRRAHLERVDEKLGHHSSATVSVRFDRTPAQIIGAPGDGFRMMLLLMNNARIGVTFEALGLCEAARDLARSYAAERPSMGKTIDRHEIIADYLDEMDTDIRGIRALAVDAAVHEEMAQRCLIRSRYMVEEGSETAHTVNARRADHQWKARLATPLIKFIAGEKAVEIARRAVQIHGGSGYMTEYGVEKLLRDAMVIPIYEGTSQIQALMATKDTLGRAGAGPGKLVKSYLGAAWSGMFSSGDRARRTARIRRRALSAQMTLMWRVVGHKRRLAKKNGRSLKAEFSGAWDARTDFAPALLHAENLTWLLTDAAIADVLLEQTARHPERGEILDAYLERAEPRSRNMLDRIHTAGQRILSGLEALADAERPTASDQEAVATPSQAPLAAAMAAGGRS